MQYNCKFNSTPHWYTRSQEGRVLGGGVDTSYRDDEEHAGVLVRGGRFDSKDALTRRTTSHQHPVSPAIVIPRRRAARRAASSPGRSQLDQDEHAIVTREYDIATWRMYFRILDHRIAKSLSSSSNDEPDRGGGPAGGVPIVVSLSDDEDSSWSIDTSDRSDTSSQLVHSRHYGGDANGIPIMRMMVPSRPFQISIDEREEEEEEQQEEETKALVLVQFDDDEEDDGIFQFDL